MRSRISLFDRGIARNLLRRFWPLWAGYFALLLLVLPAALPHNLRYTVEGLRPVLDRQVMDCGVAMVVVSFFVGAVTAMAMFHYLYQSRSCGMMTSLPLRRETMFFTAYLTGLLPLLLADLLAAAITALCYMPGGYLHAGALLSWLALTVLGNLTFYNFAVFCAMLTGNLLVLPAVYAVLNMTAYVAEICVHELLQDLVYGLSSTPRFALQWLSPPVEILSRLKVNMATQMVNGVPVPVEDVYRVYGLGTLAIYAAVSLLFLGFALWLYRRRQMETATDVVAVPVLKPVFKYCLSFGTAVVLAAVVNSLVFQYGVSGWAQAGVLLLLLLLGALIGYFAAEMLMRKTLRVFRGHWKGFAVVAAVLTVLLVAVQADVTGFEKRLPDPAQVRQVQLNGSVTLEEPENVAAALQLHRHFVEDKARLEKTESAYSVRITYVREDGGLIRREYSLPYDPEEAGALGREVTELSNCPEAIRGRLEQRMHSYVRVNGQTVERQMAITGGTVSRIRTSEDEGEVWVTLVELTADEARELYEQAILADVREGRIARAYVFDMAAPDEVSDLVVSLELRPEETINAAAAYYTDVLNLSVEMDSAHTMAYLREKYGLEAVSQAEAGFAYGSYATGGFWW